MTSPHLLQDAVRTSPQAPPLALIQGVASALPSTQYSQKDVLHFLSKKGSLSPRALTLYEKALSHPSIETRHFALTDLSEVLDENLDRIRSRFEERASHLGAEALQKALAGRGMAGEKLDFISVATCTGSLCPGLSSLILEKVRARPDVRSADLVGMGCGGALPALEQAANFAAAHPGSTTAAIAVEVCSAAFLNAEEPEQIISNSLFGDGAAAVIIGSGVPPSAGRAIQICGFESRQIPEWREALRFTTRNGLLKNILDKSVPEKAGKAVHDLVETLLRNYHLEHGDIGHWALHAGGEKILRSLQNCLNLKDSDLRPAREVLRSRGNMSSPTVLFVLEKILDADPAPVGYAVLSSFGAGFSAHAALLHLGSAQ